MDISYLIGIILMFVPICEANFEDTRCRCICPSTEFFRTHNNTPDENFRRYYTKTSVNSLTCNSQTVVKHVVKKIVDENRIDAFLANCNCKFESRNSLLLKDVVLFVICLIFGLGGYMSYLVVVDPVVRRPSQFVPYRRQEDDVGFSNSFWFSLKRVDSDFSDYNFDEKIENNIFSQPDIQAHSSNDTSPSHQPLSSQNSLIDGIQMRVRNSQNGNYSNMAVNVFEKMEAEQNKWITNVEEQRRKVMTDHTMLN